MSHTNAKSEFEWRMGTMGIKRGALATSGDRYLNEHVQWMWEQREKGEGCSLKRIACELEHTAMGRAYYGNALRVAKDLPDVTPEERSLLDRWAVGAQRQAEDRFALCDLAIRLRERAQ